MKSEKEIKKNLCYLKKERDLILNKLSRITVNNIDKITSESYLKYYDDLCIKIETLEWVLN